MLREDFFCCHVVNCVMCSIDVFISVVPVPSRQRHSRSWVPPLRIGPYTSSPSSAVLWSSEQIAAAGSPCAVSGSGLLLDVTRTAFPFLHNSDSRHQCVAEGAMCRHTTVVPSCPLPLSLWTGVAVASQAYMWHHAGAATEKILETCCELKVYNRSLYCMYVQCTSVS